MNTIGTERRKKTLFTPLSEEEDDMLIECFGPSVFDWKRLNSIYFANYLARWTKILYNSADKRFYLYNDTTGTWESLSSTKIKHLTSQFLLGYDMTFCPRGRMHTRLITPVAVSGIIDCLKGVVEVENPFAKNDLLYYHAKNCMLVFNESLKDWAVKDFSPDYYSRLRSSIEYSPGVKCLRYLNQLLRPAMSADDIEHLQFYLGQTLLGVNRSQMFLLLEGTAGRGKSTVLNIIEIVIGKELCAELRTAHSTGRFEIVSVQDKKLLTGKDVTSDYLNNAGARTLKSLTGNDMLTGEFKNSNTRVQIQGNFCIIICSNNTLKIKFDGDFGAWRRRILLIKYDTPPPKETIANFDEVLVSEEGSGILNWMMEGTVKLAQNGFKITKSVEQNHAVDCLLKSSDPFTYFANLFIHSEPEAAITSEDVVDLFTKFCHRKGWSILPERQIQKEFNKYMGEEYGAAQSHSIKRNGKAKRGYYHFQLKLPDHLAKQL